MDKDKALEAALERLDVRRILASAAPTAIERFKDALRTANPHLNHDQLDAYAEHFSSQVPALTDTMMSAHLSALLTSLSAQEVDLLHEFAEHPKARAFVEVLQKHQSSMQMTMQKVMREEGVVVHKQSFEAAISTL